MKRSTYRTRSGEAREGGLKSGQKWLPRQENHAARSSRNLHRYRASSNLFGASYVLVRLLCSELYHVGDCRSVLSGCGDCLVILRKSCLSPVQYSSRVTLASRSFMTTQRFRTIRLPVKYRMLGGAGHCWKFDEKSCWKVVESRDRRNFIGNKQVTRALTISRPARACVMPTRSE